MKPFRPVSSRPISDSLLACIAAIDQRLTVDPEEFPVGCELRTRVDSLLESMLDLQHAIDNTHRATCDTELAEPAVSGS